jgi:hypothetical protein
MQQRLYAMGPFSARPIPKLTEAEALRFWDKVDKTDTCWLWTASIRPTGYGQFGMRRVGSPVLPHRVSYSECVGPVPVGLVLDHLCRVRHCVNPAHLEVVTQAENQRRGERGELGELKPDCPRGHLLTPENTYDYIRKTGKRTRICKTCKRDEYQARKAAAAAEGRAA